MSQVKLDKGVKNAVQNKSIKRKPINGITCKHPILELKHCSQCNHNFLVKLNLSNRFLPYL